ncbi:hypothetical protein [uncultured Jatrophihabitans sp.]|uniref:hypothetical protein n=1 Tax=uncultured Jatrophihabitans sp. TaxID=1610747 RepID=UPI0035CA0871
MNRTSQIIKGAVVAASAVALVLGATGPAGATTHHGRARVTFHVTTKGYVHTLAKQRPGLAHLRVPSAKPVMVVKRKHAGTAALVKDLRATKSSKLLKQFTVVSLFDSDTYLTLSRGTYYVVAVAVEHLSAAKVATVHVTGKSVNASVPGSSAYRIDSRKALHAPATQSRHSYLHLINGSSHPEELVLFGISSSTSNADVQRFLTHPTESNLEDLDVTDFALGGLIGPHHQAWTRARLQAHRYIAVADAIDSTSGVFGGAQLVTVH